MKKAKPDDQIKKDLAKTVQKTLIAHQFNPDKIQETMKFLGIVLGGMIGSLYDSNEHDDKVAESLENIKEGIAKGSPDD
ncbi:MAG: hypothetical protein U9R69_05090 [Thermodesulfobacteriota bacterium]|nr:hypothetical protein [Thermodesulfobacteriota bacterium]